MCGHVRQLINYPIIYAKYISNFCLFGFENSSVDKADEHISFCYFRSIFKDYISMTLSLTKNKTFNHIPIFARADTCQNDKLI